MTLWRPRTWGLTINGRKQDGFEAVTRVAQYDAIVDNIGQGDFAGIAAAFQAGAKTVLVRSGTYPETQDIVIPEDGALIGEAPGAVRVVFAGANSIRIDGSGRKITAGTVSVNNGSTAVVGVTTIFTTLLPGDWIRLGIDWYQILSITDDLNLVLAIPYQGRSLAGVAFQAQSMVVGATVQNVLGVGTGGSAGLLIQQGIRTVVEKSLFYKCGVAGTTPSIRFYDCAQSLVRDTFAQASLYDGIHVIDSQIIVMASVGASACAGHGILINNSRDAIAEACAFLQNNADGIRIGPNSDRISVTDSESVQNNGNGVFSDNASIAAIFDSCLIDENALAGIFFEGSDNALSDCIVRRNGGRGIQAGANGTVTGCHVFENVGIGIDGNNDSDLTVTGCNVHDNGSHGIQLGRANATVSGNRIRDNGGDGVALGNNADDCAVTGNVVTGNSAIGIELAIGASNNTVVGNRSSNNTGGNLVDNGSGNTLAGNNVV